jgi:hypothetical protein
VVVTGTVHVLVEEYSVYRLLQLAALLATPKAVTGSDKERGSREMGEVPGKSTVGS